MARHARLAALAMLGTLELGATPALADAPALAAVYRSEWEATAAEGAARALDWRFERAHDAVSVADLAGRVGERWLQDTEGTVRYWRIFHAEKIVLEYAPADLGLAGIAASWSRIAQLVDPRSLARLSQTGRTEAVLGRSATVYHGTVDGEEIEIWWLARESLPARIERRGAQGQSSLRLLSLEMPRMPSIPQPHRDASLAGYESIEFSDVGDRHHEPFFERLMRYEGLWHGHDG